VLVIASTQSLEDLGPRQACSTSRKFTAYSQTKKKQRKNNLPTVKQFKHF